MRPPSSAMLHMFTAETANFPEQRIFANWETNLCCVTNFALQGKKACFVNIFWGVFCDKQSSRPRQIFDLLFAINSVKVEIFAKERLLGPMACP